MKEILETIKVCCKDDESYQKVHLLVEELVEEAETYKRYLDLLERSIRNDYDSILITELELEQPGPKIVYVNDGFCRITGYTREEVIGKTPRILQGEKTDRAVLDKLKRQLKDGQSFFGHTVNYRKDGSEFINQWDIHPLTDENGNITHWVSYQHDVTERKRSEKIVLDTQIEFDNLKEEAKSTKADINPEGRFISASKTFRELVGYDAEELREMTIWDLASGEDVEKLRQTLGGVHKESLNGQTYIVTLSTASGTSVEVAVHPRFLSSDGEQVIRLRMNNRSLEKRIVNLLKRRSIHDKVLDKKIDFTYGVKKKGEQFIYSWVSDSFGQITGLPEGDIKGAAVQSIVASEDWPKVEEHLNRVLRGKSSTEVYQVRTKGGKTIPVIDSANPKKGAEGGVESIKGSVLIEISSEKRDQLI